MPMDIIHQRKHNIGPKYKPDNIISFYVHVSPGVSECVCAGLASKALSEGPFFESLIAVDRVT